MRTARQMVPLLAAVVVLQILFRFGLPYVWIDGFHWWPGIGNFWLLENQVDVLQQVSINAILAFGMTMAILIGGIDLPEYHSVIDDILDEKRSLLRKRFANVILKIRANGDHRCGMPEHPGFQGLEDSEEHFRFRELKITKLLGKTRMHIIQVWNSE